MRTFLLAAAIVAHCSTRRCGHPQFRHHQLHQDPGQRAVQGHVATGVAPFARASGSPSAIDRVAIEVRGDTLVVQSNPSWGGYPGTDPGPVEVTVGTHDLTSASLIGSGSVEIDRVKGAGFTLTVQGSGAGEIGNVDVDQLNVSLEGTANAKLGGKAGKLTALVRGMSTLDAANLAPKRRHRRRRHGHGRRQRHRHGPSERLGTGDRSALTGRPACTLKVSGSTSVSGCR